MREMEFSYLLKQRIDRHAVAVRLGACALFSSAAFTLLPKGFAIFGAFLIACTFLVPERFIAAWREHRRVLSWITGMCAAVILLAVTSMQLTGREWQVLDKYARFLLMPWCALLACALSPPRVWLWAGALLGVSIAFAVALTEDASGVARVGGWHNSIVFANAVLALLVIAVYCRPEGQRPWIYLSIAVALVLGVVTIVLSGTRGAMPGFGLMLLVAVVGGGSGRRRWYRSGGMLAFMLFVLLLMWTVPWLASQTRLDGIQTDLQRYAQGHVDSPVGARLQFLSLAWQAFLDHPLTGVGLDNFAPQVKLLPQCVRDLGICQLGHAHNDIAQWSATLGVPGLLAIISIYLVPFVLFVRLIRSDDRKPANGAAWAGVMLVLVFLLSGMTQSMFSHALTTMTYVIFIGLLLGLALRESADGSPNLHESSKGTG